MTPQEILNRPIDQRRREFKYRFGQSVVFGLPVVALQYFGHALGGSPAEAERWIALLQALLAGWVTYVAVTGMVVEGLMLLRQRVSTDLLVAGVALAGYLFSVGAVLGILLSGRLLYRPTVFHYTVVLTIAWCGWRWLTLGGDSKSTESL